MHGLEIETRGSFPVRQEILLIIYGPIRKFTSYTNFVYTFAVQLSCTTTVNFTLFPPFYYCADVIHYANAHRLNSS